MKNRIIKLAVLSIFIIFVLWIGIFFLNVIRVNNTKTPILYFKTDILDKGRVYNYIGYKFIVDTDIKCGSHDYASYYLFGKEINTIHMAVDCLY